MIEKELPPDLDELTLLDEDLSAVDTSLPLLREGLAMCRISKVDIHTRKGEDGNAYFLRIQADTTSDCLSTTNKTISAPFPLFHYIGLTPLVGRPDKRDYSLDDIKRALARFSEATLGRKEAVRPLEKFLGKPVMVKIRVDTRADPPMNRIDFVRPKPGQFETLPPGNPF